MNLSAGFTFEVGPSYRIDWQNQESHIHDSPVSVPDLHDVDRYNNLSIWEIDGRLATGYCNQFYAGVESKYGWVGSGNGTNRSLFINDTAQYFDTHRASVTGHTFDLLLFGGYRFYFLKNRLTFIPSGGYEHHEKRLIQNNGESSLNGDKLGFDRRDNFLHKDHIRGPFAGFDFEWTRCSSFFIFGAFHWNWYLYTSRASVNFDKFVDQDTTIENHFKSSVDANITGPSAFLGISYNLTKCAFLSLKSSYYYTYLNSGTKRNTLYTDTFFNGVSRIQDLLVTPMKMIQLNWSSWSIQLVLGYDF
jgi:hypothetical protein